LQRRPCVKPPPPPPPVTLADLDGSFTGTSTVVGAVGCTIRFQTFDAEYEVPNAAKEVALHIEGCIDPNPPRPSVQERSRSIPTRARCRVSLSLHDDRGARGHDGEDP
jgi:hypothetical protein